eukprot:5717708-Prymnesium_polylepis.2
MSKGGRRAERKSESEIAPRATPPVAPPTKMASPIASLGGGMPELSCSQAEPSAEARLRSCKKDMTQVTRPSRTHVRSVMAIK